MLEQKIKMLKKVVDDLALEDVKVNNELAYAIFGDDLSIEMSEDELREMFLFEL